MDVSQKEAKWFRRTLLRWEAINVRDMPWKGIKDPYLIWLSEIILQQTRVEQGWDYYLKFKEAFPTVEHLAKAEEQQVLKLWQGLGYYSRARNLHATAKFIAESGGEFQSDFKWLIGLKGVGPYTAAAIASFAFDLPYAVVDGNVYRFLSRFFALETPIDKTIGKRTFQQLADLLLDENNSAKYNQAIIDFGSTVCKPKIPLCETCPFKNNCLAKNQDRINIFPVKEKSLKKRKRYFNYLDIRFNDKRLFRERKEKDVWQGLFDFPMIETTEQFELDRLSKTKEWKQILQGFKYKTIQSFPRPIKQQLTHQSLYGHFYIIQVTTIPKKLSDKYVWVAKKNEDTLPFPKMISFYLADKGLYLNL